MPHIKKLSDGKYLIRVSRGTGKDRRFINHTFTGKLKDANTKARELESEADHGAAIDASMRFEAYLEKWLVAVKPSLAPRTLDGYDGYIRRYALDSLRNLRLNEIRPIHIQDVIARTDKSATTVRNLHASLRACLGYAVRGGLLRTNPCKTIDLPRKKRHREISVLTIDEASTFSRICREMPNGLIFRFALETGMSPEEYLALRWRDIVGAEVSVQQVVQHNRKGGGYYFKEPKAKRRARRVPIGEELRADLMRHRTEQLKHRLSMKGTWFDHNLIFPNVIGRPFELSNLTRRYFRPIADACNLSQRITLYSLRHSCATILLMLGENPKVVADRLGHASVVMTLDTYSHVLPTIQAAATAKMANVMRMKR